MNRAPDTQSKSPALLLVCLAAWVLLCLRYSGHFSSLIAASPSVAVRIAVLLCLAWIHITWFYGVFHLVSACFSVRHRPALPVGDASTPPIAILYAACNDFSEPAAIACLQQNYRAFRLFILDDSTDPEERDRIDAFARTHQERCEVVRRPDRSGFKAGNLNHALRQIAPDFEHFAVVDADEILPLDFLSRTLPYLQADPSLGFVQANHRYRSAPATTFEQDMSRGVNLHWGWFLPARNRHGFVMFYGHGALIRTRAWEEAGGFPEIVSEDIAFTTRLRECGWGGVFAREIVAEESFPSDYQRFLRREIKVVQGTLEFLRGPGLSFLRSRRVGWVEKVDMLLSIGVLYLPLGFMGFLALANLTVPIGLAWHRARPFSTTSPTLGDLLTAVEPFGAGVQALWSWDFYLLTLLSILAPLIYQLPVLSRQPSSLFVYLFRSTSVFLAAVPDVVLAMFRWIASRRCAFVATGDRTAARGNAGRTSVGLAIAFGVVLTAAAVWLGNFALLTISLSFLLGPIFMRMRWERKFCRLLVLVPFCFFFFVFASVPLVGLGVIGALACTLPAHH